MRVKLILLTIVALGLWLLPGVTAQKGQKKEPDDDPCANAKNNFELKECLAKEYEKADAELNTVYRQLTKMLEDDAEKAALVKAQKAWLAFRDAQCDYEASSWIGGTGYGGVLSGCLAAQTNKRTGELRADINNRKAQ